MPAALSASAYRARLAAQMPEETLQEAVLDLAHRLGWLTYHTHDSRRSTAGFPDLVLVHERRGRLVVAELKRETGRYGAGQEAWLVAFASVGVETHVWRPSDLLAGRIADQLTRPPPAPTDTGRT